MKKISWFSLNNQDASGEFWFSQGYQNAALETIQALQKKECGVFYNREDIPFHVNFCPPPYYQSKSKYTVGYTPWESTKIPEHWVYSMQKCDEIWSTSEFISDIYRKQNANANIYTIPHGVSENFSIYDRQLTGRFVFLHVGGDSKRKNAQMVVDAFLDLYDDDDDYRLVLKYNKFCTAECYVDNKLVPAIYHPQIIGIGDNYTVDELVELYHKCHCMVYPTMGEGFGMIPFESIATGMPTILTDATGCKDFSHYGIPLSASFVKADWQDNLYAADTGNWASPDFDELLHLMSSVVNEYEIYKKFSLKSAKILHSEFSWAMTADKILKRLEFYENSLL